MDVGMTRASEMLSRPSRRLCLRALRRGAQEPPKLLGECFAAEALRRNIVPVGQHGLSQHRCEALGSADTAASVLTVDADL